KDDIGGKEADLAAAVEDATLIFHPGEGLALDQHLHGVGDLDFAAGALPLLAENGEDLGLEDVAAGDEQVGGRFADLGLFDHAGNLEAVVGAFAARHDAIARDVLGVDFLDADDVAARDLVGVDHLPEDTRL